MKGATRVLLLTAFTLGFILFSAFYVTSSHSPASERIPNIEFEKLRDRLAAQRLQSPVQKEDKIVVIGKLSTDDTSWVETELPDWQSAIYTVNDTTAPLHTPQNKGRETLPYLTYLIDNYDSLPSVIAFVHPHKDGYPRAWHTDAWQNSNVRSLRDLNTLFVQESGYTNLRCNTNPGCPEWMKPNRNASEPIGEQEMPDVWPAIFGADVKMPEVIAAPCCAQFAVSAEQVRRRPREQYEQWRTWVMQSELDDDRIGHIWEYLWHIAFGRDAVHCPEYKKCQCNVYGRFCIR